MKTKSAPALIKAINDTTLQEGQFSAVVSVFNTTDSVGDVVVPGAFTDSLAAWKASGSPIPVVWSHDWNDPFSHIGFVMDAHESDVGLEVTGQLDLENPKAAQVYKLLKGGRVKNFSFAFDVLDESPGVRDGTDVTELRKMWIHEVGPTLLGAHRDTELLDIKRCSAPQAPEGHVPAPVAVDVVLEAAKAAVVQVKAGRVLSKANEDRIRQAGEILADVLDDLPKQDATDQSDDGKATPEPPAKSTAPDGETADKPTDHGTASSSRLRTDLDLSEAEADSLTIRGEN